MQAELFNFSSRKIDTYGGYSWGYASILEKAGYAEYISGLVITPRWIKRLLNERDDDRISSRLIIDNGAYPAFVNGEDLSFAAQIEGIHCALADRSDAEWIVAPDVVGNADQTWRRIIACANELECYGLGRLLLPVQDGMDIASVVALAHDYGCGIFVGGSGWKYKIEALKALKGFRIKWLHVGRASSFAQMQAAAEFGANSVDSTSFLRRFKHNVDKRDTYARNLAAFANKRRDC